MLKGNKKSPTEVGLFNQFRLFKCASKITL